MDENTQMMLERIKLAGIKFTPEQEKGYINRLDDLGVFFEGMTIPLGYKKCGSCQHIMKLYFFNKNSGSKTNTTGNCKGCQKVSAAKSYDKTKHKRDYKKYYAEHKEQKQANAKQHYEKNKDIILTKQKQYHSSKQGKKVMQKAHSKRRIAMMANQGIPYTRELVIDRDKREGEFPICYYCENPIKDISGHKLHIDHVIPILINGHDCFTNVACMHDRCNLIKKKDASDITAQMISDIRMLAEDYIDAHPDKFNFGDDSNE